MQDVELNDQSDIDSLPVLARGRRRAAILEDSDTDSIPGRPELPQRAAGAVLAGGGHRDADVPAARVEPLPVDRGNSKFRHWCFTYNNWQPGFEALLRAGNPVYYLCQAEIGANGTRHLQGVISFPTPRTFSGVRRLIPGWHVENMQGTIDQAVAYCSKEETRDPDYPLQWEFGVRPVCAGKAGGRSDLKAVAAIVQSGGTLQAIADTHPVSVILFHRGIERLIGLRVRPRDFPTEVFWYYGPTGTGKTRAASDADPGAYWKSPSNQWWCGYEGHEAVIIDDYRADFCKFYVLLRLLDRYPMQVEVKGGMREFCPRRIYITTPKSPVDTWASRTEEEIGQLTRRIKEVRHFPAMFAAAVAAL